MTARLKSLGCSVGKRNVNHRSLGIERSEPPSG